MKVLHQSITSCYLQVYTASGTISMARSFSAFYLFDLFAGGEGSKGGMWFFVVVAFCNVREKKGSR